LQSLVERYGIILGYPDQTFRGNRAMTRSEFIAALNTFLTRTQELLVQERDRKVIREEDLVTIQQLQSLYGAALEDLRTRLDRLEATTGELEANEFSTTTKLQGQAVIAFSAGSQAGSTVIARTRLNFLTSFAPQDLLLTQLETGNNGLDAIGLAHSRDRNLLGTLGVLADGGGLESVGYGPTVTLSKLYYTIRPQPGLAVTVGPRMAPRDFIDRNSFANNSAVDFSSSFFVNNPLIVQNTIDRPGGAGAAIAWNTGPFTFRTLYIAANASDPNRDQGSFLGGTQYQGSAELEYQLGRTVAVRLQYTVASINQTTVNAGGINAEWALNRKTAVFARYGFGTYRGFNTALAERIDLSPNTWAIGLFLRDVAVPGASAGLAVGQPFVEGRLGNATQTNWEVFYNLPLNDQITVTPVFSLVNNPNNRATGTIWQGTLRTVLSF
ncbi:MAG: iron uptake porin, partial [Leptolyngbyaceae cyanobacterium bins.59]|nr:iron uptake porin [Leptolyngbyaceae cyanobacterium bins.59]